MNVLSLFDGMSCGQIALKELGIISEKYYASEVDKHAIKQTQLNFPNTIQLGDVTKWKDWDIKWKSIDLVLAGSPCQGFSFAGKQLAFDDPRSRLFFVFIDILNHIKSVNPDVIFLLENVNMKRSYMRIISEYCGVFPVNINSGLVSAQNRSRWYWTNIRTKRIGLFGEVYSDIPQPEDKGIFLRDIIEDEVDEKYYLSKTNLAYLEKVKGKGFSPKINPDKAGCLTIGNNSSKMSFNSGTALISIEGKAPIQRRTSSTSLDKKHNYQYICVAMRGREDGNQHLELQSTGKTNCLTSVQKDNMVLSGTIRSFGGKHFREIKSGKSACLIARERNDGDCLPSVLEDSRIRRLTPIECSRLQTVPSWYKWDCSDTKIYKMLGNGWTVEVIKHILKYLLWK